MPFSYGVISRFGVGVDHGELVEGDLRHARRAGGHGLQLGGGLRDLDAAHAVEDRRARHPVAGVLLDLVALARVPRLEHERPGPDALLEVGRRAVLLGQVALLVGERQQEQRVRALQLQLQRHVVDDGDAVLLDARAEAVHHARAAVRGHDALERPRGVPGRERRAVVPGDVGPDVEGVLRGLGVRPPRSPPAAAGA